MRYQVSDLQQSLHEKPAELTSFGNPRAQKSAVRVDADLAVSS
jgi:hypothetical protein